MTSKSPQTSSSPTGLRKVATVLVCSAFAVHATAQVEGEAATATDSSVAETVVEEPPAFTSPPDVIEESALPSTFLEGENQHNANGLNVAPSPANKPSDKGLFKSRPSRHYNRVIIKQSPNQSEITHEIQVSRKGRNRITPSKTLVITVPEGVPRDSLSVNRIVATQADQINSRDKIAIPLSSEGAVPTGISRSPISRSIKPIASTEQQNSTHDSIVVPPISPDNSPQSVVKKDVSPQEPPTISSRPPSDSTSTVVAAIDSSSTEVETVPERESVNLWASLFGNNSEQEDEPAAVIANTVAEQQPLPPVPAAPEPEEPSNESEESGVWAWLLGGKKENVEDPVPPERSEHRSFEVEKSTGEESKPGFLASLFGDKPDQPKRESEPENAADVGLLANTTTTSWADLLNSEPAVSFSSSPPAEPRERSKAFSELFSRTSSKPASSRRTKSSERVQAERKLGIAQYDQYEKAMMNSEPTSGEMARGMALLNSLDGPSGDMGSLPTLDWNQNVYADADELTRRRQRDFSPAVTAQSSSNDSIDFLALPPALAAEARIVTSIDPAESEDSGGDQFLELPPPLD